MYKKLKLVEAEQEYRYITNHGVGPGTLPDGVYIRSEDLKGGKTAIYLNRPLSKEELEKYDIKPEWIQEAAEDDIEEVLDQEENQEENQEEVEEIVDQEVDQEENPVKEESILDTQLDELREILVDLDLNLYRIASKEKPNDAIYIIGKVAENSDDVLMLIDNQPTDINDETEIEDTKIEDIEPTEEATEEATEEEIKSELEGRFDFVKLPLRFDEINKLYPRYGDELTPDHEAIVEYLMNCLIEINPKAAEELQKEEPEINTEINNIEGEEDFIDED